MEDYVTFDQAMKLKELGFDWITYCVYDKVYKDDRPWELRNYHTPQNHNLAQYSASAPTLSQVQKWFREVHGIDIDIDSVYHRLDTGNKIMYGLRIGIQKTFKKEFYLNHYSYNEALSTGIDHALKLIKKEI